MTSKLSIIVPIYNVEQYLRKCVESLIKQDFSSYEIILVDDGSTDNSSAICDEYASKHNTSDIIHNTCPIRVIHQDNAGLSAARNTGIMAARGTYLMFVDSDDYIESNVLSGVMEQVERDDLDVLRYRLQYVRIKECQESRVKNQEPFYEVYNPYKSDPFKGNDYSEEPTDGVTFLNTRMSTQCYAWQFVIKRDLIYNDGMSRADALNEPLTLNDACLFTEGIYFEDTEWTPRMLVRAKRVASTNTVVYNYLQREGSITNAVNKSKQKKVLDDKIRLIGEMQKQTEELGQNAAWFEQMIALTVISIVGILSTDFYEERKDYLDQLKSLDIFPIANTSIKAKLINLSPCLAVNILHLKNK